MSDNGHLTLEKLQQLTDASTVDVAVPEWNAVVRVGSFTAQERSEIERLWGSKKAADDPWGFRLDVLSRSLRDGDGKPLGTPEQLACLADRNAQAVERLFEAACTLNALGKEDIEDLEGN